MASDNNTGAKVTLTVELNWDELCEAVGEYVLKRQDSMGFNKRVTFRTGSTNEEVGPDLVAVFQEFGRLSKGASDGE